jgi:hypothetical protein
LDHFTTRGPGDFLKSLLHVARHEDFVPAPFEVKLQHWDAPPIHSIYINPE